MSFIFLTLLFLMLLLSTENRTCFSYKKKTMPSCVSRRWCGAGVIGTAVRRGPARWSGPGHAWEPPVWTGARRGSDGPGGCRELPRAGQLLTLTRVGGPGPGSAPQRSGRGGVVGARTGL